MKKEYRVPIPVMTDGFNLNGWDSSRYDTEIEYAIFPNREAYDKYEWHRNQSMERMNNYIEGIKAINAELERIVKKHEIKIKELVDIK